VGVNMKVHEFQAKGLFGEYGIPCPRGIVVEKCPGAEEIRERLQGPVYVVKAQIHAGGRGKGRVFHKGKEVSRGVVVVKGAQEASEAACRILGNTLVTVQTGPAGKTVNKVLIENGVDIDKEFYLAAIVDRERAQVALMASSFGGTEIEVVAKEHPEAILTQRIDPLLGYRDYNGRELALGLGLPAPAVKQFASLAGKLYKLFVGLDCSLAEVNPLVLTRSGELIAIDAKLNFDDNASYRHPELARLRDLGEEEPSEVEAAEAKLSYIKLHGNIGCLVNGAGLAMATMDVIKDFGGNPANFLDVGGTATPENVAASFRIMLRDEVAGIFVNVFGGIVRCDVVAQGLVDALSGMELKIPVVVRLQGNRKAEAVEILSRSGLPLIAATDMKDGAAKIVAACKGGE